MSKDSRLLTFGLTTRRGRAFAAVIMFAALSGQFSAARAAEPAVKEQLPAPAEAIESLEQELERLKIQVEMLSAGDASAQGGDGTAAEKPGEPIADRVSEVEKRLGKFADAEEKKKKEDARKPSLVLGGQVQGDMVYFGQDAVGREAVGDLQDGCQFRRLRLTARGKSFEVLEYSLGVDFALAYNPSYLDNYIEAHELPWLQNVRVGHYFEPFSLERVTQNRNNTFMERSLVDTFAPARNMGVMTYGNTESERATWQIGTFRTNSDNTGNDSFDSGQALTMRGTCLPYWDEASDGAFYLHLGAAYSYRETSQKQVRFRNTPELRKQQPRNVPGPRPDSNFNPGTTIPSPFAPIFVDTGNIPANNFQLFDPEFALILGPLSLQSEYAFAFVDQIGGQPLFFNGYMAQLSYFLTGEHRPYDRKAGIHKRMEPYEDFFRVRTASKGIQTGLGAWEIAARFSNIVLNDKNIQGNNLTDFTIGLNWYLNPYTRAKFNYVRAFLEDSRIDRTTGQPIGNSLTDLYGMRFDFEF